MAFSLLKGKRNSNLKGDQVGGGEVMGSTTRKHLGGGEGEDPPQQKGRNREEAREGEGDAPNSYDKRKKKKKKPERNMCLYRSRKKDVNKIKKGRKHV